MIMAVHETKRDNDALSIYVSSCFSANKLQNNRHQSLGRLWSYRQFHKSHICKTNGPGIHNTGTTKECVEHRQYQKQGGKYYPLHHAGCHGWSRDSALPTVPTTSTRRNN